MEAHGRCPFAAWFPSPNYGYPLSSSGREGHDPMAVVLHVSQGPQAGVDAYFQQTAPGGNPDAAVSTHFSIGDDGAIHQYVELGDAAWGNGVVEDGAQLPTSWPAKVNPNLLTVSVELCGYSVSPPPAAEQLSAVNLLNWLFSTLGLAPTKDTLIGHYRISPQTRPYCPGQWRDPNRYLPLLQAMVR